MMPKVREGVDEGCLLGKIRQYGLVFQWFARKQSNLLCTSPAAAIMKS